jgi:hypothetical protein
VIGRWTSKDPAGQYYSPYIGLGNVPISNVDPDGGYSKAGAFWRNLVRGGNGIYKSGDEWGYNKSDGTSFEVNGKMVNGYSSHFEDRFRKNSTPSTAQNISSVYDPTSLIYDAVVVTAFSNNGTVMKMQSGQKLVFTNDKIIDILKSTGAARKAITIGTVLGSTGTVIGYGGMTLTGIQILQGDKHIIEGGMDITAGIVGILGVGAPGAGTIVSIMYFMATQSNSAHRIYRDPKIVPQDNTFVAPSPKKISFK